MSTTFHQEESNNNSKIPRYSFGFVGESGLDGARGGDREGCGGGVLAVLGLAAVPAVVLARVLAGGLQPPADGRRAGQRGRGSLRLEVSVHALSLPVPAAAAAHPRHRAAVLRSGRPRAEAVCAGAAVSVLRRAEVAAVARTRGWGPGPGLATAGGRRGLLYFVLPIPSMMID